MTQKASLFMRTETEVSDLGGMSHGKPGTAVSELDCLKKGPGVDLTPGPKGCQDFE